MTSTVAEWVQQHDDDPVLVSVSEPKLKKGGVFSKTKTLYQVRSSSRTSLLSVYREYKDFSLLHKLLTTHLRGACLPPVPPETLFGSTDPAFIKKRMHLLEHFLQTIVDNPFTRTDTCVQLFLSDPSDKGFDTIIKSLPVGELSEGQKMWRQALDEAIEPEDTDKLIVEMNKELDVIIKSLTQVKEAAKAQVMAMKGYAEASASMAHAFESWQVREESSINKMKGIAVRVDGTKVVVPVELKQLARASHAHCGILALEYGPHQWESIVVDAVRFEIAQAERWKAQLKDAEAKIKHDAKAYDAARALEIQIKDQEAKTKKQDPKLQQRLKEALDAEIQAKNDARDMKRGTFRIELERYSKQRAVRLETLFALVARAHVRGANMIKSTWDGSSTSSSSNNNNNEDSSGTSTTTPTSSEPRSSLLGQSSHGGGSFFRRKSLERTKSGKLVNVKGGAEAEALRQDLAHEANTVALPRTLAIHSDEKKTALKAKKTYTAKKADELDLKEGEMLTAVRIDDDLWYATNSAGKSGLVPSSHVGVPLIEDQSSSSSSSAPPLPPPTPSNNTNSDSPHSSTRKSMMVGDGLTSAPPGMALSLPPGIPPLPPPSRDPSTAPPLPSVGSFTLNDGDTSAASKRVSIAPRAPQVPEFLMKRGEIDLPPLPSNAEAMAALRAKLATLKE
jgi:hypothetical protein